ncbi:MAG: hypothetical protein WBA46_18235, partial [Thermomicrobiales bacterium]
MSSIIGLRIQGASRVMLVSTDDDLPDLAPGCVVDVTIEGEVSVASVVIAAGQLNAMPAYPLISARATPRQGHEVDAPLGTSREDTVYRRRKADLPALGAWFDDGITTGHVIRVDLRHQSF